MVFLAFLLRFAPVPVIAPINRVSPLNGKRAFARYGANLRFEEIDRTLDKTHDRAGHHARHEVAN